MALHQVQMKIGAPVAIDAGPITRPERAWLWHALKTGEASNAALLARVSCASDRRQQSRENAG